MLFIKLLAKACLSRVTKAQPCAFRVSHSCGSTSKQASGTNILLFLDTSPYPDDSQRDAYPRKNFVQRRRFHRKRKFPLEPRLALAALRSKTHDLILETFLARFGSVRLWDSPGQNELSQHALLSLLWKRKGIKCARDYIQQSWKSRLYFLLCFANQNYGDNVMIRLCERCDY